MLPAMSLPSVSRLFVVVASNRRICGLLAFGLQLALPALWSFPPCDPHSHANTYISQVSCSHKLHNISSLLRNRALSFPGQQTQSPLNRLRSRLEGWHCIGQQAVHLWGHGEVGVYWDPGSSFPWVSSQMRICHHLL